MSDPYDLQLFVNAQDPVYDKVRAELRDGSKKSHWMWFIFPQIMGLGSSLRAWIFAISLSLKLLSTLRTRSLARGSPNAPDW